VLSVSFMLRLTYAIMQLIPQCKSVILLAVKAASASVLPIAALARSKQVDRYPPPYLNQI
jgi:hypothetical protein